MINEADGGSLAGPPKNAPFIVPHLRRVAASGPPASGPTCLPMAFLRVLRASAVIFLAWSC